MAGAFEDVDGFIALAPLRSHGRSLVFELGRCHSFAFQRVNCHISEGRLSHSEGKLSHSEGKQSHSEGKLSHSEGTRL